MGWWVECVCTYIRTFICHNTLLRQSSIICHGQKAIKQHYSLDSKNCFVYLLPCGDHLGTHFIDTNVSWRGCLHLRMQGQQKCIYNCSKSIVCGLYYVCNTASPVLIHSPQLCAYHVWGWWLHNRGKPHKVATLLWSWYQKTIPFSCLR